MMHKVAETTEVFWGKKKKEMEISLLLIWQTKTEPDTNYFDFSPKIRSFGERQAQGQCYYCCRWWTDAVSPGGILHQMWFLMFPSLNYLLDAERQNVPTNGSSRAAGTSD